MKNEREEIFNKKMKSIVYRDHRITQHYDSKNIWLFYKGNLVMNCSSKKMLTEDELKGQIDFYLDMLPQSFYCHKD